MKTSKIICLMLLIIFSGCHHSTGQTLGEEQMQTYLDRASKGTTLADNSLLLGIDGDSTYYHQLKGKWLFLDYWSTSCKPCIKEMPHLKTLQAKYQNLDLEVVMINLDKKEKKWKRGLKLFDPPGLNYKTNRSVANAFFAINLVQLTKEDGKKVLSTLMPQYVLINPLGMIVDKQMPKPSDASFNATLNRHLNKSSQKLKTP